MLYKSSLKSKLTEALIGCFFYSIPLLALSSSANAASFDCNKASTKVEKTICSVQSVSDLDTELAIVYKQAGSKYKNSQLAWLKERNKCGADGNCLVRQYQSRLAYLKGELSNTSNAEAKLASSSINKETRDEIEVSRLQITNALAGRQLIIIASRKTEADVVKYINEFYQKSNLTRNDVKLNAFLSDNGWIGISIGDVAEKDCIATVDSLKSQGIVPSDSFCTEAKDYIAAFSVDNNRFQALAGRNYFAQASNEMRAGNNATDANQLDLTVLASARSFDVFRKLDGSFSVSARKDTGRTNNELNFCVVANQSRGLGLNLLSDETNNGYRSQLIETLNLTVNELFAKNKYSLNGNNVKADKSPSCVVLNKEIGSNEEADLAVISTGDIAKLDWRSSRWSEIGRIDNTTISRAQARLATQQREENNRLSVLDAEYKKLAVDNSREKIGSINLSYPKTYESLNVCTLAVSGDASVPYLEYLTFESGNLFTATLREAAIKSRDGIMSLSNGYSNVFDDLDQFYGFWQKSINSASKCNSFVGYPSDIMLFVNGARSHSKEFIFEFNKLVPTSALFDKRAVSKGFKSWEQLLFAREAKATKIGIEKLANYGVESIQGWKKLVQEIEKEKYGENADIDLALQYLEDKKTAAKLNFSVTEVRQQRLKDEQIKAERLAKEKAAQLAIAKQKRAEKMKSGEGSFSYYTDDSCTEGEESFCITKPEFNSLCEKVIGTYDRGFGTVVGMTLVLNRTLSQLYQNDKNSVSDVETYVSKGGDCIFNYKISGILKGTSIGKNMYCRVSTIRGSSGYFYTQYASDCVAR